MARLDRLATHLSFTNQVRSVLSMAEIEQIIGGPLPASAHKYQAFWSNSERNSYSRCWRNAGYHTTTRGILSGHIAFDRVSTRPAHPTTSVRRRPNPPFEGGSQQVIRRWS